MTPAQLATEYEQLARSFPPGKKRIRVAVVAAAYRVLAEWGGEYGPQGGTPKRARWAYKTIQNYYRWLGHTKFHSLPPLPIELLKLRNAA